MSSSNKNKYIDFNWKIKHFSLIDNAKGEPIRSPMFAAKELLGIVWFLDFYPKGTLSSDAGFTSCFLSRNEDDLGPIVISCPYSIEVILENGDMVYSREDIAAQCLEICKGTRVGWDNYLKINVLEDKNKYFPDGTLYIRCRLQHRSLEEDESTKILSETNIGVDRIIFSWVIHNFDILNENYRQFECPVASKYALSLKIYINFVTIHIEKLDENSLHKKSVCKISFLDVNGFERFTKTDEHVFTAINDCWTFPCLIEKRELLEERKYLKNGAIVILFDFSISNGSKSVETVIYEQFPSVAIKEHIKIDKDVKILLGDISNLYTSNKNCDVKIRAAGDVYLQAHKAILSARSPILSALFRKKNEIRILEFPETEPWIIRIFLKFIYSGIANDLDYESASKLFFLADDLQIKSLRDRCAFILKNLKSDTNSC